MVQFLLELLSALLNINPHGHMHRLGIPDLLFPIGCGIHSHHNSKLSGNTDSRSYWIGQIIQVAQAHNSLFPSMPFRDTLQTIFQPHSSVSSNHMRFRFHSFQLKVGLLDLEPFVASDCRIKTISVRSDYTKKVREVSKRIDMREAIEVRYGDARQIYKKGMWKTYEEMAHHARLEQGFPDEWVITQIRAEEDRIIAICGILPENRPPGTRNGLIEKSWPPLSATGHAVREAARGVPRPPSNTWGVRKKPEPSPKPIYRPMREPGSNWQLRDQVKAEEIRKPELGKEIW
jgi:hypothetical protein